MDDYYDDDYNLTFLSNILKNKVVGIVDTVEDIDAQKVTVPIAAEGDALIESIAEAYKVLMVKEHVFLKGAKTQFQLAPRLLSKAWGRNAVFNRILLLRYMSVANIILAKNEVQCEPKEQPSQEAKEVVVGGIDELARSIRERDSLLENAVYGLTNTMQGVKEAVNRSNAKLDSANDINESLLRAIQNINLNTKEPEAPPEPKPPKPVEIDLSTKRQGDRFRFLDDGKEVFARVDSVGRQSITLEVNGEFETYSKSDKLKAVDYFEEKSPESVSETKSDDGRETELQRTQRLLKNNKTRAIGRLKDLKKSEALRKKYRQEKEEFEDIAYEQRKEIEELRKELQEAKAKIKDSELGRESKGPKEEEKRRSISIDDLTPGLADFDAAGAMPEAKRPFLQYVDQVYGPAANTAVVNACVEYLWRAKNIDPSAYARNYASFYRCFDVDHIDVSDTERDFARSLFVDFRDIDIEHDFYSMLDSDFKLSWLAHMRIAFYEKYIFMDCFRKNACSDTFAEDQCLDQAFRHFVYDYCLLATLGT